MIGQGSVVDEVVRQSPGALGIVSDLTEGVVARGAEQSAYPAGGVAVVDVEDAASIAGLGFAAADRTTPTLGFGHGRVLLDGEAVSLQEVPRPEVIPVGLTPDRVSLATLLDGDALPVGTRTLDLFGGADPTVSGVTSYGHASVAGPAEAGLLDLVDLDDFVVRDDAAKATPAISVPLHRDESATVAGSHPFRRVEGTKPVLDRTRGMPSLVADGLAFHPASIGVALRGYASENTAAAVTGAVGDGALRGAATGKGLSHREDCTP